MKKVTYWTGALLLILAALVGRLATVSSIGYGLYHWATDMAFPQAAWEAFLLWVKLIGATIVAAMVGSALYIMGDPNDTYQ